MKKIEDLTNEELAVAICICVNDIWAIPCKKCPLFDSCSSGNFFDHGSMEREFYKRIMEEK